MKKNIAFVYIIILAVMLSACGNEVIDSVGKPSREVVEVVKPAAEDTTGEIKPSSEKEPYDTENEEAPEEVVSEENPDATTTAPSVPGVENTPESAPDVPQTEVKAETIVVTPMENTVMYANTDCNVRKGPGTENEIVGTMNRSDSVTVNGYTDGGWYRVDFNGSVAYISRKLLQEEIPAAPVVETASTETVYTDVYCTGLAKEIFDATNAERAAAGVDPLIWDDRLAVPAGTRAQEIITDFSHTRPDGTKCYSLSSLIWGENIARGPHATGAEFVAHWMASEGHKANILQSQYKTIGIGFTCTEQGDTAVQLFGTGD